MPCNAPSTPPKRRWPASIRRRAETPVNPAAPVRAAAPCGEGRPGIERIEIAMPIHGTNQGRPAISRMWWYFRKIAKPP